MSDHEGLRSSVEGNTLVVRIDDGKANALSHERIDALHGTLDRAETDASAVCFVGRPGMLSAGFDLKVMQRGPEAGTKLVRAGGELLMRLYVHPQPTVVAVTGHALAAGALFVLACDTRWGASDAPAKIGLNETAIGLSMPEFGSALAQARLTPSAFTRAVVQAEIVDPAGALDAGFLDRLLPAADLEAAAIEEAQRLGDLPAPAYRATKRRVRRNLAEGVLERLDDDLRSFVQP
jgi:enoyl-CoA hydratase